MSTDTAIPPPAAAPDPQQKKKLIQGVLVWIGGWALAFGLVPVVNGMDLAPSLTATLNGVLLLGFPKLFLVLAVAIMGKPGFAYLKSLIASHFKKLAPPATVSPLRYRIGLIMFVTFIVLGALGPYVAPGPLRQEHPHLVGMIGDLMLVVSLFVLGGDFWDKLRALFVRDAKAVFPAK